MFVITIINNGLIFKHHRIVEKFISVGVLIYFDWNLLLKVADFMNYTLFLGISRQVVCHNRNEGKYEAHR